MSAQQRSTHTPGPCQCYVRDGAYIQCQLCAAAPALLEALEALLGRIDSHFGDVEDHSREWKEQALARAAIRAAKGQWPGYTPEAQAYEERTRAANGETK